MQAARELALRQQTRRGTVPCRGSAPRRGPSCPESAVKRCPVRASDTILPTSATVAAMSSLDVWGLDDVAETAYRAMLRNPDLDLAQLSRHLDLDPEVVGAAVDELRRVGLVSRSGPGLAPASPASTLAALVHVELSDLEERRSRLDAVRASLSGFAADHMVGQSRAWSSMPFELLSADESFAAVEDLQRGTTGEVLSSPPGRRHRRRRTDVRRADRAPARRRPADARPLPDRGARRPGPPRLRPPLGRGRRDGAPAVRVAAVASRSSDPRPRWCPPDGAASPAPRAISLVRAPALVAMARELFEQYWARGLRPADVPARGRRRRPAGARAAAARPQGRDDRPAPGGLAADRPAAGRDGDGRARCDHTFPGGYGGSTTRPDLMAAVTRTVIDRKAPE